MREIIIFMLGATALSTFLYSIWMRDIETIFGMVVLYLSVVGYYE